MKKVQTPGDFATVAPFQKPKQTFPNPKRCRLRFLHNRALSDGNLHDSHQTYLGPQRTPSKICSYLVFLTIAGPFSSHNLISSVVVLSRALFEKKGTSICSRNPCPFKRRVFATPFGFCQGIFAVNCFPVLALTL